MPVICIGPVCVPLNLFLPFIIGVLHQYGYLKWFKREWVDYRWWFRQYKRHFGKEGADAQAGAGTQAAAAAQPGPAEVAGAGGGAQRAEGVGVQSLHAPQQAPEAQTQAQVQAQAQGQPDASATVERTPPPVQLPKHDAGLRQRNAAQQAQQS